MFSSIVFEKLSLLGLIAILLIGVAYFAFRQRGRTKSYTIGQELADARKNEEARLKLGNQNVSPLPRGKYEPQPGEWGLLNPAPSELDAQIRESCTMFRSLSNSERLEFTSAIPMDEFFTLITFAKRMAVFALRNNDTELLEDGIAALAMIESKRTDYRDILVSLALLHHTALRIGLDADALLRDASRIAGPEVSNLMIDFVNRNPQSKNLKDSWGYIEVETAFGRGFAGSGFEPFAPKTDLLGIAMRIASVIDSDDYQTVSIELASTLPEVWLKTSEPGHLNQTLANVCAGAMISARLKAHRHQQAFSQQFTVFIVEMDSSASAKELLNLSQSKKAGDYCMLGVADNQIFCLVIARSFVQGVDSFEKGDSLNRFQKAFQKAIGQTTTPSAMP